MRLIDLQDPASLTVADRAGFVLEGVLCTLHLKEERRADTVVSSKLPGDPSPGTVALAHDAVANAPGS